MVPKASFAQGHQAWLFRAVIIYDTYTRKPTKSDA